jgi:hypothetical protein
MKAARVHSWRAPQALPCGWPTVRGGPTCPGGSATSPLLSLELQVEGIHKTPTTVCGAVPARG